MDAGATRQAAGAQPEAERRAVPRRHVETRNQRDLEVKGGRHHLLRSADLEDCGLGWKCE